MVAKHWCRHCETYVDDNRASRARHEQSPRHRAALERIVAQARREAAARFADASPTPSFYGTVSVASEKAPVSEVSPWRPVALNGRSESTAIESKDDDGAAGSVDKEPSSSESEEIALVKRARPTGLARKHI